MLRLLRTAGLGVIALGLVVAPPVAAQQADDDIRKEIEALKQGQQNMQRQLTEIKQLLQQQAKAQPQQPARRGPEVKDVVFELGQNEVKGKADAKLTLLEFTDYQ